MQRPLHARLDLYTPPSFERPSAIQQRAIVPVIKGHDVIAQAQSGTRKTAMFSISILQKLDPNMSTLLLLSAVSMSSGPLAVACSVSMISYVNIKHLYDYICNSHYAKLLLVCAHKPLTHRFPGIQRLHSITGDREWAFDKAHGYVKLMLHRVRIQRFGVRPEPEEGVHKRVIAIDGRWLLNSGLRDLTRT